MVSEENQVHIAAFETALTEADNPSFRLILIAGNHFERMGLKDRARALYDDYAATNPDAFFLDEDMARLESGKLPEPIIANVADGLGESLFNIAGLLSQGETVDFALGYAHAAAYVRADFWIAKVLIGELLQSQNRSDDAIAAWANPSLILLDC